MDVVIISDMLDALDACYSQKIITLNDDSDVCKSLMSTCLDVCVSDEWRETSLRSWDEIVEDVSGFYTAMSKDGGLEQLEETFQKLDDALINTVIDYYIDYELHDKTSDAPKEFVLESLKMDAMDNYDKIIREVPALKQAV